MDVKKREFRVNPPREELDSLAAIVRDYSWRFPRSKRDMVWEWCRVAPSLRVAVERACASRSEDGKMHNHQSRVHESARNEFCLLILEWKRDIMRILNAGMHKEYADYKDPFDALHDLLDRIKPPGIGPVTVYDVATRIGAYLGVEPTSLYIHAGVRIGLNYLSWATIDPLATKSFRRIDRIPATVLHTLWPEFSELPPDEVEDFLCTYRDCFADLPEPVGSSA